MKQNLCVFVQINTVGIVVDESYFFQKEALVEELVANGILEQNINLIVYKDKFDDPNLPGEMTVTVSFKKVLVGTEITIKQEGIPEMIPTEMCYLGWQESLVKLAQLVEPEIKS